MGEALLPSLGQRAAPAGPGLRVLRLLSMAFSLRGLEGVLSPADAGLAHAPGTHAGLATAAFLLATAGT